MWELYLFILSVTLVPRGSHRKWLYTLGVGNRIHRPCAHAHMSRGWNQAPRTLFSDPLAPYQPVVSRDTHLQLHRLCVPPISRHQPAYSQKHETRKMYTRPSQIYAPLETTNTWSGLLLVETSRSNRYSLLAFSNRARWTMRTACTSEICPRLVYSERTWMTHCQ